MVFDIVERQLFNTQTTVSPALPDVVDMEFEKVPITPISMDKPKGFNKKLGVNAIVSTLLKNIIPLGIIKKTYQNDYKKKRCSFVVM